MAVHNISRNEAHRPSPHVRIRFAGCRRRPAGIKSLFLGAIAVGVVASLIDTMVGKPVCITLIFVGFWAWRCWPTGQ